MKLITLNIWGGRVYEPLMEFLRKYSREVDVFCFQESFDNLPGHGSTLQPEKRQDIDQDIRKILKGFDGWLAPMQDHEESPAMYVRKTISIKKKGEEFVYRWKNAMVGGDSSTYGVNIQYAQIEQDQKQYTICNMHGHWTPYFKGDNKARLEQSRNAIKFLDSMPGPKIFCGDFNMDPDTESMRILEGRMRNLIKEYEVASTRNHFHSQGSQFADYIMVSPEVTVKDFKVMQDVVSDHLPLLLEFE